MRGRVSGLCVDHEGGGGRGVEEESADKSPTWGGSRFRAGEGGGQGGACVVEVEEESSQMDDAELGIVCDDDDSDEEIRVPAKNENNELPAQRGESSSRTMPVSASSSISPSDDERAPAKNCKNPAKNELPAQSDASRISPSDDAQRGAAGNDAHEFAALKEEDELYLKMCAGGGGGGGSVERGQKPPASPESQRDVSPLLGGYLYSATQDCIARLLFGSTEGEGLGDAVFLNFLVADA
jgi:hypothetical protein